jgi:hypothetical protein
MPPRGTKKGSKRARQYELNKEYQLEQGRSEDRAEEIAAGTVNKEWARHGESKTSSRSAGRTAGSPCETPSLKTWGIACVSRARAGRARR